MIIALQLGAALLLDAIFGEPRWLWSRIPHPVVVIGRLVSLLEKKLYGDETARIKGVFALVTLVFISGFAGWVLSLFSPVVVTIMAAILLAQKSLIMHVKAVADGLGVSIEEGRAAVSMIVSRDVSQSDASAVARASLESLAENFSDGVVAPAFWFLVGGLPGMLIYKSVNTADSMIGYRNARYENFGWASARADDLLNLIPARLTAFLIYPTLSKTVLLDIYRDARLHRSPNAGWPEAALAYRLNVALAGPRTYDGQAQAFEWVNEKGCQTINADHIDAGCFMIWRAWVILLVYVLVASLLISG